MIFKRRKENKEIPAHIYEFKDYLCTITRHPTGWRREMNLFLSNGKDKFDFRDWSANHADCSVGHVYTVEEMRIVYEALKNYFEGEENYQE